MKKIRPARSYELDAGYPPDPESTTARLSEPRDGLSRRHALVSLAAGAATLGGALLGAREARADAPASPPCPTTLTLPYRFRFCGGTFDDDPDA